MSRSDRGTFDYDRYVQRNREIALEMYGHKLDENRNIIGTDYYFDFNWRLCKKGGAEG